MGGGFRVAPLVVFCYVDNMIIRRNKNKAKADKCQRDFEAAWRKLQDDPSEENEAAATALYERCSNYSPTCPVCVQGRQDFISSLNALRAGDFDSSKKFFSSSFKTMTFKLDRIWSAFTGG